MVITVFMLTGFMLVIHTLAQIVVEFGCKVFAVDIFGDSSLLSRQHRRLATIGQGRPTGHDRC